MIIEERCRMIIPSADKTTGRLVGSLAVMLISGNELSVAVLLTIVPDMGWLVVRAVVLLIRKTTSIPPHRL
jgi:hypothetical protein